MGGGRLICRYFLPSTVSWRYLQLQYLATAAQVSPAPYEYSAGIVP